jgi:cytochrome c-type biogenesis protein CcsB
MRKHRTDGDVPVPVQAEKINMENLLSTKLFYCAFSCYCGALISYLVLLASEKKDLLRAAVIFMIAGFLFHSSGIALRTSECQHLPLANMFEYMLVAAWFSALCYFVIIKFVKNWFVSACNVIAIVILMAIISLLPKEGSSALMPALRSYWLSIHVTAAAASEGLFAIGFASSILYLLKSFLPSTHRFLPRIPELTTLDAITYRSIVTGYLLFTLGALFAGAIWAHRAWGSFWSWDPKETCSLVVWIIYSAYLHVRINRKLKSLVPHLLSIAGFIAALLTFFSTMFLGGMHSYG